jgi:hypothetical protein
MKTYISRIIICIGCVAIMTRCNEKENNTPPIAGYSITPNEGSIFTLFSFDASACSDAEDVATTLHVRWDWEGDGIFDTDFSTNKILTHQYSQTGLYNIVLEVKDSEGLSTSTVKSLEISHGAAPAVTTSPISNITATSAVCGGNVTDIGGSKVSARGVCWNTIQNPTISDNITIDGEGSGVYTSHLTGLASNTKYYIRAYATNFAGTVYGTEDSLTTLYLWTCGDQIIIDHIAGNIAPVDKTVVYSTVTDIPGEETKCWINKNLGADYQASSISDPSESSAGWYWQFNLPRGYKHDGFTRTPNSPWNNSINENSDWLISNDPCAIELGDGWRIPTKTEWNNIDAASGWTEWTGPWNSALKLHAGGFLNYPDAELRNRGISGSHWSSTQVSYTNGWHLDFRSTNSGTYSNTKAFGLSLRCIK